MLVLSRKVGQEIIVGDSVRITVTKVVGNRVTLGVEAPDDVRILRGELQPIVCSFEVDVDGTEPESRGDSRGESGARPLPELLAQTVGRVPLEESRATVPFVHVAR